MKGQEIEVRIIKLNKKRGNIVVSRKQIARRRAVREEAQDPRAPR